MDAYSGISGAGCSPRPAFHFPEANENLVAYNVGRHRHTPEIDQVLTDVGKSAGKPVEVIFTPPSPRWTGASTPRSMPSRAVSSSSTT